ncbi:hypothetical protein ACL02T_31050 [Pseudonocardia sp. RS010]|uniref:hypothetical protein n=1 Tax=Pseudonocardia sp. RS010 TaxID=3385979 RepID=UPI0039A3EA66
MPTPDQITQAVPAGAEAHAAAGIDVRNLAGGTRTWAAAGRTVSRDDGARGTVA